MKTIRLNRYVAIRQAHNNAHQRCIHCLGRIRKGNIGISMTKPGGYGMPANIWIHIKCYPEFVKELKECIVRGKYQKTLNYVMFKEAKE